MGKGTENGADRGIAFYIETLALLTVFTAVIVVLVNSFFSAGRLSRKATVLSKAVHLAESAAEMVSSSESGDMLFGLLDENGNASVLETADGVSGSVYRAKYDEDLVPAADGIFYVDVSWAPEEGGLVRSTIDVYSGDGTEPVYALELAAYVVKH